MRRSFLLGRSAEKRFGNGEIARELSPLLFSEPPWNAPADILLNISRIAPEHAREAGEIFAAFVAEAFQDLARIVIH